MKETIKRIRDVLGRLQGGSPESFKRGLEADRPVRETDEREEGSGSP